MKRAIVLVGVYFLMQLVSSILCMAVLTGMDFVRHQTFNIDVMSLSTAAIVPSLILGFVLMAAFLWRKGYLKDARLWNITTFAFLGWSILLGMSLIFLIDILMSLLNVPDFLETSFDVIESGWIGILAVAIIGPVLEEMLFRGAITKELLKQYEPLKAILISGLIFGIFHLNPAQIFPAMLIGFVLAWLYWRTGSLVPGILIHIVNNSLSCYLSITYPDTSDITELLGTGIVAGVLLAVALGYFSFKQLTKAELLP